MADDPEARRVSELLDRITRGELSEAETEELELYAQGDPELRAVIAARTSQAALGGGWLARVEADHRIARAERSPRVLLERGLGGLLVALGVVAWAAAPVLGPALAVAGLGLLVYSWIRVNHSQDPYKDIQR
ncbi:hypothetical protein [Nannocystis punicea]|uniref:DUF1707 domain-containing protein n=1 Tax=Nannocystis punicea TaxID=2995304 RepID=A0ABY7HH21_9BACT|nr:hypothetical protein [Nannocystis poenicansa]WAS98595.1 hypothetical protein O0S08_20855 [Nannocystis poenicansa]